MADDRHHPMPRGALLLESSPNVGGWRGEMSRSISSQSPATHVLTRRRLCWPNPQPVSAQMPCHSFSFLLTRQPRDPPDWEFHHRVQLIPPVSTVGEPFEVDHQDLRQGPQVKLLCGLLMLLTVGTVPKKRNLHSVGGRGPAPPGRSSWRQSRSATSLPALDVSASGQGGL